MAFISKNQQKFIPMILGNESILIALKSPCLVCFSQGWATFIQSVYQNEGTVADPLLEPFRVEGNFDAAFGAFGLIQKDSLIVLR